MAILKSQHQSFAEFFATPTRDALAELLKTNIGETDYLDFKADWPDIPKLAKHILAIANSGSGALVVGVAQQLNGGLLADGLSGLKDKAELVPPLGAYLPNAIQYEIFDFAYTASESPPLIGKFFQVLLIEDTPKELPFLALKDGNGIRANALYVRSGTRSTEASHVDFQTVINRRIETGHSNQKELDLDMHLSQLKRLDELRDGNDCWINMYLKPEASAYDNRESSDYRQFIEEAYEIKKAQVMHLLGLAL